MHTADSKFPHWLHWFIDPENYRAKAPFLLNGWAAATDGRIAVATTLSTGVQAWEDVPLKIAAYILDVLATAPVHEAKLSKGDIWAMFGSCEHPVAARCRKCDKDGKMPHDCSCELCEVDEETCDECGGKKITITSPEPRHVAIWNTPFDPNRVAYLLEHAPAAEEYVMRLVAMENMEFKTMTIKVLVIVADTWSAVLAPLADSVLREYECLELMTEVKPGVAGKVG